MHAYRGEATPILPRKVKRPAPDDQVARLGEAFHRLIEQGIPVTDERVAQQAHVSYHVVAAFLQEKRGTSQREAE